MELHIGEKIRQIRVASGLTQEELASRCDLSKGFISQLERDLTSPSIATLTDILESLGTSLHDFFRDEKPEQIVWKPTDVFSSQDEEKGTLVRWLIPNAQKNGMEPIMLELAPGARTELDDPHPGEEFGLVLSGTIQVVVGEEKHRARKDCAFYFRPTVPHQIINTGTTVAKIVWVSMPPSF